MPDCASTEKQVSPDILAAVRQAVSQALPRTFQIDGKTFWLSIGIGFAQIKIFDTQAATEPIAKQVFSCMPVDSPDSRHDGSTVVFRFAHPNQKP
jgi:hypothetical protein